MQPVHVVEVLLIFEQVMLKAGMSRAKIQRQGGITAIPT